MRFLFFEDTVALAVEGEFQADRLIVNIRQVLAVDVLIPCHKRLFGFDQLGEEGFVIAFPVEHRDRPLRAPFVDYLDDPLFHLALAFVDDEIDDAAGMIAGNLAGPPRHRHSTLGVVAIVHLLFAAIGQKVPVGEPDI